MPGGDHSGILPVTEEAHPIQQVSETLPEDPDVLAARQNRRTWWRRAIVMVLAVIVGAPAASLLVWAVHQRAQPRDETQYPGPRDQRLRASYETYMQTEGHTRRALNFAVCAHSLDQQRFSAPNTPVTEEQILFYLGPPDLELDPKDGSPVQWVYFYGRNKESVIHVSLANAPGARTAGPFGWNAASAYKYTGYALYSSSSRQPSTTQPASNGQR